MQRYIARIIRAVVVCTLGFGGGAGLFFFIYIVIFNGAPNAFELSIKAGLIVGLIFSAIIVGILLPMDLSAHLFLRKGLYREVWELEQTRDVEVDGTNKQVVSACRQALLVVPYITNVSDDTEHLITRAATGPSWRSAGEELEVEINPISATRWSLKCTSKSKGKNVLFDYGKNYENVETWRKHLIRLLAENAASEANPA
ncbi:MAG TPA: hypothetical protein V6C89_19800 [Drouetiella sp.]|jgi:hypothetical protein